MPYTGKGWTGCTRVLILDGSSEHDGHVWRKMGLIGEENIDKLKCLKQIKSYISTMSCTVSGLIPISLAGVYSYYQVGFATWYPVSGLIFGQISGIRPDIWMISSIRLNIWPDIRYLCNSTIRSITLVTYTHSFYISRSEYLARKWRENVASHLLSISTATLWVDTHGSGFSFSFTPIQNLKKILDPTPRQWMDPDPACTWIR